ncbi:MAG TPA: cyclopropane-fatty-acyl-phospholipid synthase family protein [Burkholderiales bacterium]|nr:cyclopropane-fatty-acyl-phospholipid synthase family protein [Burkholderiales bacterium]
MTTIALRKEGSLARRLVLSQLEKLHLGRLWLHERGETQVFGAPDARLPLEASVTVRDPAFYADVAFGGSIGAAESYMEGRWEADDLTAAMRLLLRNREVSDGMDGGLAGLAALPRLAVHWLRRNTRAGSRRNIRAHYDLGNEFFRLMLDETMMYSCALFESPGMSLAEAQRAKLDRICRALALAPRDHVLEIGTGWGGFALHAAERYGCRVTTTTISPSQASLARERVRAAGLEHRITILEKDYRDLRGRYDKLVSIEMIEAIGHQYFEDFFAQSAARLAPGGRMLLQSITIADQRYEQARDEVDFIKRYIFPGCCIPSITALLQAMTAASNLRLAGLEDIGPHYAPTLARWRDNMSAQLARVRELGYGEAFLRMWTFYLCYCEAGFTERALGDVQMLIEKPA